MGVCTPEFDRLRPERRQNTQNQTCHLSFSGSSNPGNMHGTGSIPCNTLLTGGQQQEAKKQK